MATPESLEKALWKGIEDDRTLMLGLEGHDTHMRPMTALLDEKSPGKGPLWIFTSVDNGIVEAIGSNIGRARACYVGKRHDLFACLDGPIQVHNDRAVIDRLWNPFIAAWYEEGKDDPKLRLLRFDARHAHVWENENSLLAGIRLLFGADPKQSYADKTAEVDLR